MLDNLRHYLLQEMVDQGKAAQHFAVISLQQTPQNTHDVLAADLASFDTAWHLAKDLQDKSGYNQLLIAQGFFHGGTMLQDWQVLCCLLPAHHSVMARQTVKFLAQPLPPQATPTPAPTAPTTQKWAHPLLSLFTLLSVWQWPHMLPLVVAISLWGFEWLIATNMVQRAVPEASVAPLLKGRTWFYALLTALTAINLLTLLVK